MADTVPNLASPAPAKGDVFLSCLGIKKTFKMGDSRIEVLKRVDLSVSRGEFLAIEGRSGSGKSTLLHILGALDESDGGSVTFDGRDIAKLSGSERSRLRCRQFGFVFQFYHLLPELNVLENTMLAPMISDSLGTFNGRKNGLKDRAMDLLSQMNMGHRLKHRPQQLSGGERQRVAIARALMSEPSVLYADEPTGNLDFETGRQIMGVLEGLHQKAGQTIVMVTHDRTIASRADRTLVLESGVLQAVS